MRVDTVPQIQLAAEKLVESFKIRSDAYPSNTLMWPWGHDFMFTDAHKMFDSMDRVIQHINGNPSKYNVNVRYGTPQEYFDILHQKEIAFPVLQQDFLPYGPTVINWWNGYYTSRPLLKARCRHLDHIQRTAEFVYTMARSTCYHEKTSKEWQELFEKLEFIRKIQGIMQHHDAITGTMREHVLNDYYNMIIEASTTCGFIIESVLPLLISSNLEIDLPEDILFVTQETVVDIPKSIESPRYLILSNSLPWSRTEIYSFMIKSPFVKVYDVSKKQFITSSILPPLPSYFHGRESQDTGYRLYFESTTPPLGSSVYILYYLPSRSFEGLSIIGNPKSIIKAPITEQLYPNCKMIPLHPSENYIENDEIKVELDNQGNILKVVQKLNVPYLFTNGTSSNEISMDLEKNFWVYKSDPAWDNHYTFKALDDGKLIQSDSFSSYFIIKTPLVQEIYQTVNQKISQRVTLFKNQNQIQFSDYLGPPDTGVNYIARFSSSVRSDGYFYTDDSGLEIIQRSYNSSDIYSGNYYPMIYSSFIREERATFKNYFSQISFVSDRTHGITSVHPGTFDIMLHRNSLQSYGNLFSMLLFFLSTILPSTVLPYRGFIK